MKDLRRIYEKYEGNMKKNESFSPTGCIRRRRKLGIFLRPRNEKKYEKI